LHFVCIKKIEADPTCTKLQGTHTANYKKCPTFIKIKTNKRPIRPNAIKSISALLNPENITHQQISRNSSVPLTYDSTVSNNTLSSTTIIHQLRDLMQRHYSQGHYIVWQYEPLKKTSSKYYSYIYYYSITMANAKILFWNCQGIKQRRLELLQLGQYKKVNVILLN